MRARTVFARVVVAATTVTALSLGSGTAAHAVAPGISVNDVSISEGNAGTSLLNFTIVYGGAAAFGVTVDYATADVTAIAGSDYVSTSGTAALPHGGCKCATVSVPIIGDTVAENTETFQLNLSNPVGKTLDDNQGVGTITDDDTPGASIDDPTVAENSGTMTFTVSLDATAPYDSILAYTTTPGTATAGNDYTAGTNTLTIPSGSTTGTIDVPILDDATYEGDETLTMDLSIVSGLALLDNQGTGTIAEDDPVPSVTVDDPAVGENGATETFTVSLDAAAAVDVSVDYATSDNTATAGADYTATSGTATIPAGSTSTPVDVPVQDDSVFEGDETFNLDLSGAVNGSLVDAQGQGTISEDDAAPNISVDDPSVAENGATLTFTVSLDTAAAVDVSVDYTTNDVTALGGSDYTATGGTATILAGDTSATVDVPVSDDAVFEGDETLTLDLSNEVNGVVADASGEGTITEDDPAPTITIDDPAVAENGGPASFTISLDAAADVDVAVDYATNDGTATAGTDYTAKSGTKTIAAGATSATVNVQVDDDALYEGDESFALDLANPVNGQLGGATSGTATINDDDAKPAISVDDPTVAESAGPITFTVSLDAAAAVDVNVDFVTTDDSATDGPDYTGYTGTATVLAGDTSTTVDVPVVDDSTAEPDESFTLDLSNPVHGTIGDGSGTGTITDDDASPAVSIADATVTEGNTGTRNLTFTVSLTNDSASDVSVNYATSDGTATGGSDYATDAGTLTIPAGQTAGQVQVVVNGDTSFEPNETVTVTLSNLIGGSTIDDATATGTITNDDKQPSILSLRPIERHGLIKARGVLEPASAGNLVKITLAKRSHGHWVKVASKTVTVRKLGDRDHDGKQDAAYGASFPRPATGRYRFSAKFAGDGNTAAGAKKRLFQL
jgi:Calx-beta domain-containing protein